MQTIIEKQKIKTFVNKIIIEWPGTIDHCFLQTDQLVYVHLKPGISPETFIGTLFPKVGMFVDFHSEVTLYCFDFKGVSEIPIYINKQ